LKNFILPGLLKIAILLDLPRLQDKATQYTPYIEL